MLKLLALTAALTAGGAQLPRYMRQTPAYRNLTRNARIAAYCQSLADQAIEDLNDETDPAPCLGEVR